MKLLIYKNDKKQEGTKQPDFRVFAVIDDKFTDVGGAWWNKDKKDCWYQSVIVDLNKKSNAPQDSTEPIVDIDEPPF